MLSLLTLKVNNYFGKPWFVVVPTVKEMLPSKVQNKFNSRTTKLLAHLSIYNQQTIAS